MSGPLVALTSYGSGCAWPDRLSVYTRLSAYASWLNSSVPGGVQPYQATSPSPPPGVHPLDDPALGAAVCGRAAGPSSPLGTAVLDCGVGLIANITFASYGTPTGSCGAFKQSSCASTSALGVVQSLCLGRSFCRVPLSSLDSPDPCPGTKAKKLLMQALCGPRGAHVPALPPPVPHSPPPPLHRPGPPLPQHRPSPPPPPKKKKNNGGRRALNHEHTFSSHQ